jgi:hypothetical protein
MRFYCFLVGLLFYGQILLAAENPVTNEFVKKQFGSSCSVNVDVPAITADLNGDGIEDVVIPARCTNPMSDQGEFNYRVIDPYYTFFGYGNPKVTTQYGTDDPQNRSLTLLIIHGAGADAWRAEKPKAKFLIVNLPYKKVSVKRMLVKKKVLVSIYVDEAGVGESMSSAVFWDGKKYKYQPMGANTE